MTTAIPAYPADHAQKIVPNGDRYDGGDDDINNAPMVIIFFCSCIGNFNRIFDCLRQHTSGYEKSA